MHPPPISGGGGGGGGGGGEGGLIWTSNQIFKKRGRLDKTSTFRGSCRKRCGGGGGGVWLFQEGGCNFNIKD